MGFKAVRFYIAWKRNHTDFTLPTIELIPPPETTGRGNDIALIVQQADAQD